MKKIKIIENGPLLISGGIPLIEMIITPTSNGYEYITGKIYEIQENYSLCRCGSSNHKPFCDGKHLSRGYIGKSTASTESFLSQAVEYVGVNYVLRDVENLCAFARFCHTNDDDIWNIFQYANDEESESVAIKLACDCPAGRLVMIDKKTGKPIENKYQESIVILQDPSRHCSGPLWVRGGIQIEDENGKILEKRNRITLCRCGSSTNKPYCDASHISVKFNDKESK